MVNVTMNDIVAFGQAEGIFNGVNLPLKVAYKLNKLKQAIATEGEFYSNKFQEIVDKYAQKDENGNIKFSEDGSQILIETDKIEECNNELENLQTLTVEIDNQNLTIEDFGEDVECTPEDLEVLIPFLN